jgi:hypothetical protein
MIFETRLQTSADISKPIIQLMVQGDPIHSSGDDYDYSSWSLSLIAIGQEWTIIFTTVTGWNHFGVILDRKASGEKSSTSKIVSLKSYQLFVLTEHNL